NHLLSVMPADTVVQRRARALIAFLFLTGSREGAAITVRLRHVDLAHKCVQFDGRSVDTKFGKSFTTSFFPFCDDVERILRDWIMELRQNHLFSDTDPLFPKTRVAVGPLRHFQALGIARAVGRPVVCSQDLQAGFRRRRVTTVLAPPRAGYDR
ncbi:MAG: hypothetical protein AAFY75_06770, partial [Pseudomonadota bacterium]